MSPASAESREFKAGGRTVRICRPGKVLFPDDGITKADLARYYRTVAHRMLPQLCGRPLMLERHPDGIGDVSFMQKDVPDIQRDAYASFTLRDISARLEGNPWQNAFRRGRSLGPAGRRLDRLR